MKEVKKKETRCDINLFRSYHIISTRVFFGLKCQNFASDLIQCYCANYVCLSAYECLQIYVQNAYMDAVDSQYLRCCKNE